MVELLRTLKQLSGNGGEFTEMFQTHPLPENRIERTASIVRDEYESHEKSTPDPNLQRFARMRQRLRTYMKKHPVKDKPSE
jgi:predicted Zn-dependent protease